MYRAPPPPLLSEKIGGGSEYRLKLAVVEVILAVGTRFSGRCCCREVAVAERFKQESMYGLSSGAKKMAVIESWPLWRGAASSPGASFFAWQRRARNK